MLYALIQTDSEPKSKFMGRINPVAFDGWKPNSLWLAGDIARNEVPALRALLAVSRRAMCRNEEFLNSKPLLKVNKMGGELRIESLVFTAKDIDALVQKLEVY